MQIIKIPKKKKGEFREICVPSRSEKEKMRAYLPSLNEKAKILCNSEVVHGFMHGKSPVTNALKHVGFQYTLKFDLSNFFDTVKPSHLKGKLSAEEIAVLLPDDRAYQGLPTSPIIANLAAKEMDAAILKKIKDTEIVYTRYADDLCFSFNSHDHVAMLKMSVGQIVGRCGFRLNKQKTWLQDSRYGNRHITGVMVGKEGIVSSRNVRRRLRAANHQKNTSEARGLAEWAKLKVPNPEGKKLRVDQNNLNALCRQWKVNPINLNRCPDKGPDIILDNNVIITGDPIQMLGLSNFTTGWKSCMSHPDGQYHRRAPFWCYLKGTRIAGILSGKEVTIHGITRSLLSARALIHELEDGTTVFDRIYHDQSGVAYKILEKTLEDAGYKNMYAAGHSPRVKVVGTVRLKDCKCVPYLDSLGQRKVVGSNGDNYYHIHT